MLIFAAWVKIYSAKYFCNARVCVLGEIFVWQLYSIYYWSSYPLLFFCLCALITDTLTGLTSSLDSILNTTTPSQLSECSPTPAKETDANNDTPAPVSDQFPQKTTASEHVQMKSPAAS